METKTVYLYDIQRYYAGTHELNERDDKTPVTKEWIIPANSTEVPMNLEPKEHYLIQWNGTAWEYVEDKGNPPPQPEPEPEPTPPTKEEKIASLDAEYDREKSTLCIQYTDAQMHGDTETADALIEEMATLDAWYDTEYEKIIEEE